MTNNERKSFVRLMPLALTICLMSTLGATRAYAFMPDKGKTPSENITLKPGPGSNPQNVARVSRLANLAITKIQAAEADLDKKQDDAAKEDLSQAQELVDNIRQTGPTVRVIADVRTARKHLHESETVPVNLVPIDAELVEASKVVPLGTAREHYAKATQSLKANQRKEAEKHLAALEENVVYAEADLPISRTRADILSAEALLSQNKPDEAKNMLSDSLNHITVLAVDENKIVPLKKPQS